MVRAVHVATVRIRNSRGARLVETRQLLSDGTVRRRGPRPLSEKMRPGESPEAAAARAVREELGARARARIHAEVVDGVPEDGELETEETGKDDGGAGAGAITVNWMDVIMWILWYITLLDYVDCVVYNPPGI